jgi:hypothetical protein
MLSQTLLLKKDRERERRGCGRTRSGGSARPPAVCMLWYGGWVCVRVPASNKGCWHQDNLSMSGDTPAQAVCSSVNVQHKSAAAAAVV